MVSEDRHTSVPSPKKTKKKGGSGDRHASLKQILLVKREALIQQIKQQLGQSVTEEQQRRLEAAMDSGDQALVDLEREMGISLQEMRNRERQLIDDALDSLDEGTYGMCADCGKKSVKNVFTRCHLLVYVSNVNRNVNSWKKLSDRNNAHDRQ